MAASWWGYLLKSLSRFFVALGGQYCRSSQALKLSAAAGFPSMWTALD